MRPESFRFSPPTEAVPDEVAWVLARAFSERAEPAPYSSDAGVDGRTAVRWSRTFKLSPRIAARTAATRLAAELGSAAAEDLLADHRLCVARALRLQETVRVVAGAAADCHVRVILLKGAAIDALGIVATGARDSDDLDLLVSRSDARRLEEALSKKGFRAAPTSDAAQHLPAWTHHKLLAIEPHLFLPGVSTGGGRSAARFLEVELLGEWVAIPIRPVLVAHCLAHALFQHGYSPYAYPLVRAVADLLDLSGGSQGLDRAVDQALPYLRRSVSEREARAIARLGTRLGAGELPVAGEDAQALLRHTVAGSRDPGYCRRLRRRAGLRALLRLDWRKLSAAVRDLSSQPWSDRNPAQV
jgi:putative nucleotidyltransferase-like protein